MEIATDSNEWVRRDGDIATVGITKKASQEIGDIVYVELPMIGQKVVKGDEIVVLESTKAAIDSYAPVSGEVIEVNHLLKNQVELISLEPEAGGWLYKVRIQTFVS